MVVLALETVTKQGSVAILVDDVCRGRAGDATRTHGERLPRELLALLDGDGPRRLEDVDLLAIVAGPGSFTGIRVGMASVQGLALVTGKPVTAIPTLEAMAEGWRMGQLESAGRPPSPSTLSVRGYGGQPSFGLPAEAASAASASRRLEPRNLLVISCLDGQRGDVFFAAWSVDLDRPIASARSVIEPGVGTPVDLVRLVEAQRSDQPAVVVGIGLDRHAAALGRLDIPVEPMPMRLADVAARLAARDPQRAAPPHALRPIYIRRPDAELARERAGLAPR